MKNRSSLRARVRGFTLIEIIVVVGIIALLAALIVPAVMTAQRKATRTKAAAELIAIGTALEAYKADFGDIPRSPDHIGFAVLCKALVSPGPANPPAPALAPAPYHAGTIAYLGTPGQTTYEERVAFGHPDPSGGFTARDAVDNPAPPSDNSQWATFDFRDGKDGPGFKARAGGKPYPAYLSPEKFKVRGLAILDSWGNPILYFPARPGAITQTPGWRLIGDTLTPPATDDIGVFDLAHNITFFQRVGNAVPGDAMKRMSALLVKDTNNFNGTVPAGASAVSTREFLLWSAGPDGKFGVDYTGGDPTKKEIEKNDDIANFREQ